MIAKVLVTVFLIMVLSVNSALAENSSSVDLPKILIPPDSLYYSVVRGWEKVSYYFSFTRESKISYYRNLLRTKISELKMVVDEDKLGETETSANRVIYYSGVLGDSIIDKYQNDQSKDEDIKLKEEVTAELKSYVDLLNGMRDKYQANSSYWMLIQHSINSLDILINRLNNEIR